MRLLNLITLAVSILPTSASPTDQTVTISSWPLNLPSPAPLAQISYNAVTGTANLTSYTAPSLPTSAHLVRVGLRDPTTNQWSGVVTSAKSFGVEWKKRVALHTDLEGAVYAVGFTTAGRRDGKGRSEEVEVVVVPMQRGAQPVLNKPVVLNAEGKIEGKEPEKTFLQKYWWAIALFLLVQIAAPGGKE
ncbi:hypothetical protein M501DRAFT_64412 [Patellaria atrata CBS 101060]|uniref:Uncharacterized protein n=1 Tax=Patellaria atrata CBS 101060 TaxID=1346257 RepID=A0A9P4SIK2_9PEZI|nr:hypothetical protein M501DRAFT_64412 [Patellaria atrata CBS 101060]